MTKNRIVTLVVTLVAVAGLAVAGVYRSRAAANIPACYAGDGQVCPSDQFSSDYQAFLALRDQVVAATRSSALRDFQAKSDQLVGLQQRLGQEIPKGYQFDEGTRKFVKIPPTPTAAPPAIPDKK